MKSFFRPGEAMRVAARKRREREYKKRASGFELYAPPTNRSFLSSNRSGGRSHRSHSPHSTPRRRSKSPASRRGASPTPRGPKSGGILSSFRSSSQRNTPRNLSSYRSSSSPPVSQRASNRGGASFRSSSSFRDSNRSSNPDSTRRNSTRRRWTLRRRRSFQQEERDTEGRTRDASFLGQTGRVDNLSERHSELNGSVGTISHYDVTCGRFAFTLSSGMEVLVRAQSIEPVPEDVAKVLMREERENGFSPSKTPLDNKRDIDAEDAASAELQSSSAVLLCASPVRSRPAQAHLQSSGLQLLDNGRLVKSRSASDLDDEIVPRSGSSKEAPWDWRGVTRGSPNGLRASYRPPPSERGRLAEIEKQRQRWAILREQRGSASPPLRNTAPGMKRPPYNGYATPTTGARSKPKMAGRYEKTPEEESDRMYGMTRKAYMLWQENGMVDGGDHVVVV